MTAMTNADATTELTAALHDRFDDVGRSAMRSLCKGITAGDRLKAAAPSQAVAVDTEDGHGS